MFVRTDRRTLFPRFARIPQTGARSRIAARAAQRLHHRRIPGLSARAWGADAVLLIAAALEQEQLERFEAVAHELGMTVLLELHDETELEKCRNLTTPLWGVNNRNLRTFEVSLDQTLSLLPALEGKTVVTESGITGKADVEFMRTRGVHTFLIGETFMRADDIEAEVGKLF